MAKMMLNSTVGLVAFVIPIIAVRYHERNVGDEARHQEDRVESNQPDFVHEGPDSHASLSWSEGFPNVAPGLIAPDARMIM